MKKYLFTDGTTGIKEVASREELEQLINAAPDRNSIHIWEYPSNQWQTYHQFSKTRSPTTATKVTNPERPVIKEVDLRKPTTTWLIPKAFTRIFIPIALLVTIFLIYNFTRITWTPIPDQEFSAERPANSPAMDIDSLIQTIEANRGQKLDKVTRTNLRIRNTWPERLLLSLKLSGEKGRTGIKYHDLILQLDNATGYQIREAIVEVSAWKKDAQLIQKDTVRFQNFGYSKPIQRKLSQEYLADSIAINFLSIQAPAFNFCYTRQRESNYGNLNDRWFCKE